MNPELSVLTVTHDRCALVAQKLQALAAQTLAPEVFEWVVLVNGCKDGTLELLKTARTPYRLKLLVTNANLPISQARNRCAAAAAGDVLYFSDDDCLPEPETLARHVTAQQRPGVVIGGLEFVHAGGRESWRPRRVSYWNLNGANTSVPAAAFRQVGGFDESLSGYGGEDVMLGHALKTLRFTALPDAAAQHLGPNPVTAADPAKASSAGRNAVRIAARYPELAYRLGVHHSLLALKRLLLRPRGLGRLLSPHLYRYERAYLEGALEEKNRDRRSQLK